MASSSASASSTSSPSTPSIPPMARRVTWVPLCEHGLPTDILTSNTEKNPGRRFFRCQVRKWDDCEYFQWVDDIAKGTFCRYDCGRRLRFEKEHYERLLQIKEEECDSLKVKLQAAINESEELKKWRLDAAVQKLAILVVVVAVVAKLMFGVQ